MLDERKWERGVPLPEPPLSSRKNNTGTTTQTRSIIETAISSTKATSNTSTPRTTPWKASGKTIPTVPPAKPSGVSTSSTTVIIPPAPKENPWGNKNHKPETSEPAASSTTKNHVLQTSPRVTQLPATTATPETNRPVRTPVPKVSAWGRQPATNLAGHLGLRVGTIIPPSMAKTSMEQVVLEGRTDHPSSFPPLGTMPEPKMTKTQQQQQQQQQGRPTYPSAAVARIQLTNQQPRMILQPGQPRTGSSTGKHFAWTAHASKGVVTTTTTPPPIHSSSSYPTAASTALGTAALSGFPALGDVVQSSSAQADPVDPKALLASPTTVLSSSEQNPKQQPKAGAVTIPKRDKTSKKKKVPEPPIMTTKSKGTGGHKKNKKVKDAHQNHPRTGNLSFGLTTTAASASTTNHPVGLVDQHLSVLQRMMIHNKGEIKKGRQRLKPRKKQFTSLKKKVLEERLRKWKELHPDETANNSNTSNNSNEIPVTTTVCLYGYSDDPDERNDDDEYDEMVENLREMANRVGKTRRVFVPRHGVDTEAVTVFVEFGAIDDAIAAVACWNGLVLGGEELQCRPLFVTTETSSSIDDSNALAGDKTADKSDEEWQEWCLKKEPTNLTNSLPRTTDIYLENALTEEDLEDEECMEESLDDIRTLASKFGEVERVEVVEPTESQPSFVRITYVGDENVARNAAVELGKNVIGGQAVSARLTHSPDEEKASGASGNRCILLRNVLTNDDLEDEECLEESLNDLRELAQKFGTVKSIGLDTGLPSSDGDAAVRIVFSAVDEAKSAASGFEGMVVGGLTVNAMLLWNGDDDPGQNKNAGNFQPKIDDEEKPMFSGDKIISERFAACKRVPKVITSAGPRRYATLATDESVKPLLVEMLGELMRLQLRAAEENNAKVRRRVVLGLREVARGIRSHKVKLVVMANNLDEYGVIDEKVQTIIDSAHAADVPVFYEFSKRTLGKALGKNLKIGVAGVQNAEGAHQQFKKLIKIASSTG